MTVSRTEQALEQALESLPLVDHHVHGALTGDVGRQGFETFITESDRPGPAGVTPFDSQLGFAIRRWCAPVLDLDPHAMPQEYMDRRQALGVEEVNRRLLTGSGIAHFLLDTGLGEGVIHGVDGMREASGQPADEIVRLEVIAEDLAARGVGAGEFADRFREALAERTAHAAGVKSIIAYRYGLDFDPEPPSQMEVVSAAGHWLRQVARGAGPRLADPVLLRALVWAGVERGLPLQFHVGYGDPDLDLHRCDPLHLTGFLRRTADRGVPIMLLHNYPFHRGAGYLAAVFPHAYLDVGLAVPYAGGRAAGIIAESLEVAPFGKLLFSSDAYGPAELHYLGALLWRRGMAKVLRGFVDAGEWSEDDAARTARLVGAENARRVYQLR
ncbi:MAG: amidohydrolase family protein [Streptosporangiales bacterium]